jgi:hypothetical protein
MSPWHPPISSIIRFATMTRATLHLVCHALVMVASTTRGNAQPTVFDIDGLFRAVFSSTTAYSGEAGRGQIRMRSYVATDQENMVIYQATYLVGEQRNDSSKVNHVLEQ